MKNAAATGVLIGIVASVSSPSVGAQQAQPTDVAIQGYVYEPQRLSPTDARVQALSVPQGFRTGQPARQGSNSKSERGYFGPRPPAGDPPHPYHFQIFALDTTLDLPDGFNRHALLQAMRGHVLAEGELVGTFQAPQ
jgi:hypothetical protein